MMTIPVFEPEIGDDEIDAVVAALKRGEISGSFGDSIRIFEEQFAAYVGCEFGVAVNSGSSALLIAVAAAGLNPGDEVLVSSSTNIATAVAVTHNGGIPVPVDSENETWNLDLDLVETLITSKTRAIIPVHLYGHPVDMDRLGEIARKYHLVVIEDCAESHGATCRGRMTGSFGHMGCFSFYANKVITTGEGGMVTTNDARLAERLRLLRNLGFTQPRFRHEIAAYNFRMPGLLAAMGVVQTQKLSRIVSEKRRMGQMYNHHLSDISGLQLPLEREWAQHVYWMYGIRVTPEFGISRDELMNWLSSKGIETRTFFCPMNQQPVLLDIPNFRAVPCPVADDLWETGLYLPSSHTLGEDEIRYIAACISEAHASAGTRA